MAFCVHRFEAAIHSDLSCCVLPRRAVRASFDWWPVRLPLVCETQPALVKCRKQNCPKKRSKKFRPSETFKRQRSRCTKSSKNPFCRLFTQKAAGGRITLGNGKLLTLTAEKRKHTIALSPYLMLSLHTEAPSRISRSFHVQ